MELKGEQVYLSGGELAQTGYSNPIELSEVFDLEDQLKKDRQELTDLRADDSLDVVARGMLLPQHGKLDARGVLLSRIRRELANQRDLTPEQELAEIVLKGQ